MTAPLANLDEVAIFDDMPVLLDIALESNFDNPFYADYLDPAPAPGQGEGDDVEGDVDAFNPVEAPIPVADPHPEDILEIPLNSHAIRQGTFSSMEGNVLEGDGDIISFSGHSHSLSYEESSMALYFYSLSTEAGETDTLVGDPLCGDAVADPVADNPMNG
jgi:hypothetical protein